MAEHPGPPEHPGRIIIDELGQRVEHGPPTEAEREDMAARMQEQEAEQAARAKMRSDIETAEQILREAAKTDQVAAAIATLLGLELLAPGGG